MEDADLTPHGRLLEDARIRVMGLSGREAARRAGISESRWRQIVTGYQAVGRGQRAPVNPTARTLVGMAVAVEIEPSDVLQAAGVSVDPALLARMVRDVRGEPVKSADDPEILLILQSDASEERKKELLKRLDEMRAQDRQRRMDDIRWALGQDKAG